MPSLNSTQISSLQAKVTAGNIAGFYSELQGYGDSYARLGLGVTNNDTWQGVLANRFAQSGAQNNSVNLAYGSAGWVSLNTSLAQDYLNAYTTNSGAAPTWQQIRDFHNLRYVDAGLNPND